MDTAYIRTERLIPSRSLSLSQAQKDWSDSIWLVIYLSWQEIKHQSSNIWRLFICWWQISRICNSNIRKDIAEFSLIFSILNTTSIPRTLNIVTFNGILLTRNTYVYIEIQNFSIFFLFFHSFRILFTISLIIEHYDDITVILPLPITKPQCPTVLVSLVS